MKGPNNSHMQVFYLDNIEIGDWIWIIVSYHGYLLLHMNAFGA